MIDLDFGESQGVPTLWIIVNDREDFAPLRQLILELSDGSRDSIDVLSGAGIVPRKRAESQLRGDVRNQEGQS